MATNERPSSSGLSVGERHRLAGETLDACLERLRVLTPVMTVELGIRVAKAVAELHTSGRVHHALKPSGIFLAHCGTEVLVRVVRPMRSFGLATPAYLAPEQVDGGRLDPRTDVYAIGVILYQCLTGRLPYEAANMVELASKIAIGEPVALPVETDPALGRIVLRALAYEASVRFGTAAELQAALESWAAEERRVAALLADFLDVTPAPIASLPSPPEPAPPPAPVVRTHNSYVPPPIAFGNLPTLAAPLHVDPEDYDRAECRVNSPRIVPIFVVEAEAEERPDVSGR